MKNKLKIYALFLTITLGMFLTGCEKQDFQDKNSSSDNKIQVKEFSFEEANKISNFNITNLKLSKSLSKNKNKSANSNFIIDSSVVREIKIGDYTTYSMPIKREESSADYFENLVFEIKSDTTNVYFVKYTPTQEIKYLKEHNSFSFEGTSIVSKLYGFYTLTGWGAYGETVDNENNGPMTEGTIYTLPDNCRYLVKCNFGGTEHNAGPNCTRLYTIVQCSNIPTGNNYPNGTEFGNTSFGPGSGYGNNQNGGSGGLNNYQNILTTPVYSIGNPTTASQLISNLGPTIESNFNLLNQQTKNLILNYITNNLGNIEEKTEAYFLLKYINLSFLSQQTTEIQLSVFNFLLQDIHSSINQDFAKEAIKRMQENPNLKIDVLKSSKSPAYIDTSSIDNNTPEGAKFNAVYNALTISPEFKTLFKDLFGSPQSLYNVKFEIAEHVYDSDNPTEEVNGNCSPISTNNLITIKINKQILTPAGDIWKNNLEVAKTILHEFIHAYLFVKAKYPEIGAPIPNAQNMTFDEICNALYGQNVQHDFMFNHMIPTLQNILSQMLNSLTTSVKREEVEDLTIHPTTIPLTSSPWSWSSYFYYLSLVGLDSTTSFLSQFPLGSDNLYVFAQYKEYGHLFLDRNLP